MAFVKGQSGNPGGRVSEKPWRDAIMRAVKRKQAGEGKDHELDMLADQIVKLGLAGDMAAIKEIGDRIDGKPHQAVDLSGSLDLSFAERLVKARERRLQGPRSGTG